MELRGAVVVITGASSGIGAATARRCAARGATVALVARSAETLRAACASITEAGGTALALAADIGSADAVQNLANELLGRYGRVDALVNCAGFGVFEAVQHASFADLEEMMHVNLYGTVRCIQALLPHMLTRRSGQIVNVASVAGLLATPNLGFYGASKFAVVGLTHSFQFDLRGSGVHCALICPSVVSTPFFRRADLSKVSNAARLLPQLEADDVARVIVRAIARNSNGDMFVPAIARPLITLASALPWLTRFMIRLLG